MLRKLNMCIFLGKNYPFFNHLQYAGKPHGSYALVLGVKHQTRLRA